MIKTLFKRMLGRTWATLTPRVRDHLVEACIATMTDRERLLKGLPTMSGLLENVRESGFFPTAIVDVGASVGGWSRMASSVFSNSRILMFDGNPDNDQALCDTVREIGSRSRYFITLLGSEKKDAVTFYKLGWGSSVLPELTTFDRESVTLPMNSLDDMVEGAGLQHPLLLKLDVQGFELEVLSGGESTLGISDVVIMETSLLPYNEGAPLFGDVVSFMSNRGFVVFDFCGQLRRESDNVLFQTDVAFVRRDSPLRAPRRFWLSEPQIQPEYGNP